MDPSLKALIKKINDKHGDDTIILGEQIDTILVPRMPSGALGLDVILGGGWPANQWNEILGNESMGKTTVALKTVAANQSQDPDWTCVWVAAEEFVPSWAKQLGVDLSRLIVINENVMEDAFQYVIDFASTKAVDAVVIDSLPALEPSREREGKMEDFQPGVSAILTGKFFRMARKGMKRSMTEQERPILGLVINQWREKIGVMHGDPRTTPGGKAKNFHYFTRLEVSREEWITEGDRKVGQAIRCKTMKNKSHPSQKIAVLDFYFDYTESFRKGEYDILKDVVNTSLLLGTIERKGKWYAVGDEQFEGRAGLVEGLRDNEVLYEKVMAETLDVARLGTKAALIEEEPRVKPRASSRKIKRK